MPDTTEKKTIPRGPAATAAKINTVTAIMTAWNLQCQKE